MRSAWSRGARCSHASLVAGRVLWVLAGVLAEPVHAAPPIVHTDECDHGDSEARDGVPREAGSDVRGLGGAAHVVGPAIDEVLAAAYVAAGLDRDRAAGWTRRARLAGLVPLLSVRTGRNTRWQDLDPEVDRGTTIEVRASWRLDRLVFDGRELQVAASDAARRRERRQLASHVIRAYFVWRRLAAASPDAACRSLRLEQATAELDALTNTWFSRELARLGGPSAPRTSGERR